MKKIIPSHYHPVRHALKRVLLAIFLLPAVLPGPAAAAPPTGPVSGPTAQLSDQVWVLQQGYPLVDQEQVRMPTSQGQSDSIQLTLGGITMRSQGTRFDVPFSYDYSISFPTLPKELLPGQTFDASASIGVSNGPGRPFTNATLRMDWGTLTTPEGRRVGEAFIQAGQDCPSSGAPCVKWRDAQGIDSATLKQTFKVPALNDRSGYITIDGVPTIQIFARVYLAGAGSNYNNGRAVEWRYVPGQPSLDAGPSTQCADEESLFEELKFRQIHLRRALERENNLHSYLDAEHENIRASIVAGLIVDLAAMPEGWPLSGDLAKRFFDAEKHELAASLLGAGLKSVEARILKDQSTAGVGDQLTKLDFSTGLPIEGAAADAGWEAVKGGLEGAMGKTVAGASFFAFDMLKFGLSAYEGMTQLDASLAMLRAINQHISQLNELDRELASVLVDAQSAFDLCTHRASLHLPPDRTGYASSLDKAAQFIAQHR